MITATLATDLLSQPQPKPNLKPRTRIMRSRDQWKTLLEEFNNSGRTGWKTSAELDPAKAAARWY